VNIVHNLDDLAVRDFKTNEGSGRPLIAFPEVDNDYGFAVHAPQGEAPLLRPALVVEEIACCGERACEAICYLEASVGADQFTDTIPVLAIESST
jgi:hypothetical protein